MKGKISILIHSLILAVVLTLSVGTFAVYAESGMHINHKKVTVNIGDEDNKLHLEILNKKEGSKKPRWVSYNVNIASVDQNGTVTAHRKGKTTISSGIGFPREKCVITVVDPVLRMNKEKATIYCSDSADTNGKSITLRAVSRGASKDIVWSSSDETVATVVSDVRGKGVVRSVGKPGKAVITASANGMTASCEVTVLESTISLNVNEMKLSTRGEGSRIRLVPSVVGPRRTVRWTTSDKRIATVRSGRVTGKEDGVAVITATANGVTAKCTVVVDKGMVSINEEKVLLYTTSDDEGVKGETKQLKTNAPKDSKVTWSSSDDTIAVVSDTGLITAKGSGTAVITAACGGKEDTCLVEVKNTVTSISERNVALKTKGKDKTCILDYQVTGRSKSSAWTTSNSKVVTVSKGKLTAKGTGSATVTLKANGVEDRVQVTVQDFTPTVTLNLAEYTLYTEGKGNSISLRAAVDGPSKQVKWESSNENVAEVTTKGVVKAKGEGRAQITAIANGVKAKCWISVKAPRILLDKDVFIIPVGEKRNLSEETSMEVMGASQTVSYQSSNTAVAAIDRKGNITAKEKDKENKPVEITIKYTDNVKATCRVYVTDCTKHDFVKVTDEGAAEAATCEESGYETYRCTSCGAEKKETTDPLGHRYGQWVVVANATENAAGLERQTCRRPGCGAENTRVIPVKVKEGFRLVWEDNFDGDSLNTNDWNYEYHEPGWVNAELQEYVDSPENIYVKDGNLVIQAIKKGEGDSATYTSGRINTQNKHDYEYGRFEVRAKVPDGKGFLPAFWMMPTDESYYGQWPKCGEIDIMEVLGDKTDTVHGTLHFGEPHTQKQGTYTLPATEQDFAEDFHIFACEWEPGEFRYYVDGRLYYTENDWFTKKPGFGEAAYPAPYDQPFYMILNLAVGGSWVGYPDENTKFEDNAQLVVDYVRVYQRDHYDTDVDKPENRVELRDPDATGNYIINGDFAKAEDLKKGDKNWQLLLTGGGAATAKIDRKALHITTTDEGTLNYSVQVVQANLPIEEGSKYKLSYDAYADEDRTMIVGLTAPDRGYIRYLNDTTVNLTTDAQTFTHTFDMKSNSDANGRVEFNLGNQGSTAKVHITNVRLEKAGDAEEEEKTILPDGNYVYNGSFNEGNDPGRLRLAYWDWDVDEKCEDTSISVTSDSRRELKVVVPGTATALEQVIVKQESIAITGGKEYVLSFDAYADGAKTIQSAIAGQTFESSLTTERTEYKYEFETVADLNGSELKFLLGTAGTTYIDNVCIRENGLIVNGDFSSGLTGYEVYVADDAKVPGYIVDSLNEKDAFSIDIADTADQDWKIQLKQNNIKLEKDKWYKIAFDAKSTKDRKIMYALQRDGSSDDNWIPYSGTQKISLTGEYQNFSHVFKMANDTDSRTMLSISMGAVGGTRITDKHTVVIDNITLEETEPQEEPPVVAGDNLIKNGDFAQGEENWEAAVTTPGEATSSFADGKAVFNITNVGTEDWHVQLKQNGLKLEQGAQYKVTMKIKSSEARVVKYAFLNTTYVYYGGEDLELTANEVKEVEYTLDVGNKATDSAISFVVSMGQIADKETPVSTIEIDDICVVKVGGGSDPGDDVTPDENLIKNGDFANGEENWEAAVTTPGEATSSFADGKAVFNITNVGTEDWHVQLKQNGLKLEQGAQYKVTMKIKSSEARVVKYAFLNTTYVYYGGEDLELTANEVKEVEYTLDVGNKATDSAISFVVSMGQIADKETPVSEIEISDICVKKVSGEDTPGEEIEPVEIGTELIKNGDFANGKENWEEGIAEGGAVTTAYTDGKATYEITNAGTADYSVQLKQTGLTLEKGAHYKMNVKLKSTADRTVRLALLDSEADWAAYGEQADIELHTDRARSISRIIDVGDKPTVNTIHFVISMGKIGENTPASTIEISEISIIKVAEGTQADEEKEEEAPVSTSTYDDSDQDDENSDDIGDDEQSGNTDNGDDQSGNTDDGSDQSGNTDDGSDQSGNTDDGSDQSGNTGDGDNQSDNIDNGDDQSGNIDNDDDQSGNPDNDDDQSGNPDNDDSQNGNAYNVGSDASITD